MKKRRARDGGANPTASDFYVEAEYADSIFRTALGDREGALSRLKRALELKPTYAPAILSMGRSSTSGAGAPKDEGSFDRCSRCPRTRRTLARLSTRPEVSSFRLAHMRTA